jgi:hypothetical protein
MPMRPVRAHPTLAGFALIVVMLILCWAVIIAIALSVYGLFT